MNKLIAPIIITVLSVIAVVLYFGVFFISFALTFNPFSIFLSFIFGLIILGFSFVLIGNLKSRINEIREEDKDDISKY